MKMWLIIMKADLPKIIVEHAPLNPFSAVGITAQREALLYFFILAGTFPKRPLVMWLLPLVWLFLGCSRIRHAPLFSLVAMIAIIDMLPLLPLDALAGPAQRSLRRPQARRSERTQLGNRCPACSRSSSWWCPSRRASLRRTR